MGRIRSVPKGPFSFPRLLRATALRIRSPSPWQMVRFQGVSEKGFVSSDFVPKKRFVPSTTSRRLPPRERRRNLTPYACRGVRDRRTATQISGVTPMSLTSFCVTDHRTPLRRPVLC